MIRGSAVVSRALVDPCYVPCRLSLAGAAFDPVDHRTGCVVRYTMRFGLIDRIVELSRGERIVAVKAVSLAEEYLADHFPTFPVFPGVLILEALTESAAWLVRDATDFAPSLVLLREARNVTYKSFVKPGHLLRVEVNCRRLGETDSDFDGVGFCEDVEVVRARFSLRHSTLDVRDDRLAAADRIMRDALKARFAMLSASVLSSV